MKTLGTLLVSVSLAAMIGHSFVVAFGFLGVLLCLPTSYFVSVGVTKVFG